MWNVDKAVVNTFRVGPAIGLALAFTTTAGIAQLNASETAADTGRPAAVRSAGDAPDSVSCASNPGERSQCAADTSAGVVLLRSTGPGACLLGNTWGYDHTGVWVSDGCGGEFVLGQSVVAASGNQVPGDASVTPSEPEWPTWGVSMPPAAAS